MLNYRVIDEQSKESLNKVLAVLERFNIKVWLDGGTLLGVVRDQGFIPWDCDVDLSAWHGNWHKNKEIIKALNDEGFNVVYLEKSQSLRLEPKEKMYGWRLIDIHLHSKNESFAITYYYEFNNENKVQAWLFYVIAWLDKKQHQLSNEPPSLKSVISNYNNVYNEELGLCSKGAKMTAGFIGYIKHVLFMGRFQAFAKTRMLKTPVKYFESFSNYSFAGTDYLTPVHPKGYLSFKYGENWLTPIQEYDWRNDGSVKLGDVVPLVEER